ncbi:hypothetical protein ACS0TY_032122 [Phlomoides rotata]
MELQKSFLEVVNIEKQMLALIHSKGSLLDDVLELYRKIRSGYEKILLSSNQMIELHEVEHHMWKLHYELIDEFRKRIRQRSYNAENVKNNSLSDSINCLEKFKSFLSEATEFYKNLIVKLRRSCGLPPEIFLNNKDCLSFPIAPTKLHACQHTCHRLLICIGDLARYAEIIKKPDARVWSTAATYYLEATRTWPDSGNPHNQLALLATYVGDAFLALYHCIRSLAVKEPFPDAWRNITLLLEENRSTKLPSLSSRMQFDFLNPSKRSYLQNTYQDDNGSPHNSKSEALDNVCSEKFDLWPILVRTISFLLIRSSLEEFPCTLASALHSLDALLAVDDTKLATALTSYQHMDSLRRGPYRGIQLVSIFIFIVHSLTERPEHEDSTGKDGQKHSAFTPLAVAAIFICMGRVTKRCSTGNHGDICPLLPAVLVFVEWLVGALDTVETYHADERVRNALSYFFGVLSDLLDRIGNTSSLDRSALWEDHELKGFHPLIHVHETLDFTTHPDDYKSRTECRSHRIVHAATRIMNRWKISRDNVEARTAASVSTHSVTTPDDRAEICQENTDSGPKTQSTTDEEEVILFKPITRRNSAPVYKSKPIINNPVFADESQIQTSFADEWLRHATSLSSGQSSDDSDSFSFCSTTSNSGHPAGPPSLSAWVLNKASSSIEPHEFNKHKLSPIEELSSTSLADLSISETKESKVATGHIPTIVHDASPYITPMPSAPLLPDDASWLRGNSLIGHETDGILGSAPITSHTRYLPPLGMTSAEWLYHYRNSQNMGGNHVTPMPLNAPPSFGNYHPNDLSSFDLCDQWGNHLVPNPILYWGTPEIYANMNLGYVVEDEKREKLFVGYERPFPYVCGVGMELSPQQPLLQYLKDRERLLQPGSQLRGPTFLG